MFNTIRGKLLFGIIISVIIINGVFSIFTFLFLDNTFKRDIIDEISKFKGISLYTIKQNEIMEEPLWKSLASIKDITKSYVSMANEEKGITQFTGEILSEEEIKEILEESNNLKSSIKFKKLKGIYVITYNYPIYLNGEFYGNLIIQKDYIDKYNEKFKMISLIILGQVFVALAIITVSLIIIKKVTDPIKKLSNSMESFDWYNDEEDIVINSSDEVGELAQTYNLMKNKLKNQMEIIIEEKNKVEQLQKSSREFFNNATHELKTPVTAISLYAQILRDDDIKTLDDDFIYRATDRMVLESEKMKSLVEKILEVSRGKVNLNKSKVNFSLNEIVEEIIEDFEVRIKNKGLYINKNLEKVSFYGVLEDIETIIANLLDNSIKYSKGNEIKINLYEEEESIIFEISNKCVNFPKDISGKLLEPFIKYNTYEDISKEVSSSGLGLYLSTELSKENNGKLSYVIKGDEINFIFSLSKVDLSFK